MTPTSDMRLKLAAVQMAPVFMNKKATTEKVCRLIREAGAAGADVVGFPECIIPGYPGWLEVLPVDHSKAYELFLRLWDNSVEVPGPETHAIGAACRDAGTYAVVGINERCAGTTGTTFNTQLIFGPNGTLLHKHQKYVPTVAERLVHAPGQTGANCSVHTDHFGTLSGFVCGENVNNLAAYALGLKYPVVHVASWPPHFAPGAEMQNCILSATRGLAYSLKCYLINSVGLVDDDVISMYGYDDEIRDYLEKEKKKSFATILDPNGDIIASALSRKEEILYGDADLGKCIIGKYTHDIAGHYQRPELFALNFAKYFHGHSKI